MGTESTAHAYDRRDCGCAVLFAVVHHNYTITGRFYGQSASKASPSSSFFTPYKTGGAKLVVQNWFSKLSFKIVVFLTI